MTIRNIDTSLFREYYGEEPTGEYYGEWTFTVCKPGAAFQGRTWHTIPGRWPHARREIEKLAPAGEYIQLMGSLVYKDQ